jgi:L-lactate dehydrogenase
MATLPGSLVKVAIVGAGSVGATLAYACLIRGVAPDAVIVMVTNPVDVLTLAALTFSGLAPERVLGTGTVLDSSRLRDLVARHVGVAVQNVHAWIVGEHGDSEFALWTSASVGSVPLRRFSVDGRVLLSPDDEIRIASEVVTAAERIIRGKGATNYAIGLAGARVIEAIVGDESRVLPVTSLVPDSLSLGDVCLSLPSVVNRAGVRHVDGVLLSDGEQELLQGSAEAVRSVATAVGL